MQKTYILDTNVLLSDPDALNAFDEHNIILPLAVLEELDKHKSRQDEVGAAARQINRRLDEYRVKGGNLLQGIRTSGGGLLKVISIDNSSLELLPIELRTLKVDHLIIALAKYYQCQANDETSYILVSKDINVRVKCDSIGVACEDYRKNRVIKHGDTMYTGVCIREATYQFIQEIYNSRKEIYDSRNGLFVTAPDEWKLHPNQIVVVKEYGVSSGSVIVVAKKIGETYRLIPIMQNENCFGLTPRNKEQNFSLSLLFDPEIKLVTLSGIAGSGKSLLALAAGLDQNKHIGSKKQYEKLVIARSTIPVGHDIGFLPGTLHEKLSPWQGASSDNLAFLMTKSGKKPNKKQQTGDAFIDPYLSLLMENGVIEIASIAHIRGRSIPNSFVIIEEAQNLSQHEARTILTRIGEGSKIILCGDTDQIDNMYVDRQTNGLTYVIERFKNSTLAAHVTLLKGERSQLATEAANLL